MYVAVLRNRSMSSAEPMVDRTETLRGCPCMNSYEQTEGILAPQDLVRSGWALVIDLGRDARGG